MKIYIEALSTSIAEFEEIQAAPDTPVIVAKRFGTIVHEMKALRGLLQTNQQQPEHPVVAAARQRKSGA